MTATDIPAEDAAEIVHVRTRAELEPALRRLAEGDFVALDTEFMRESTYYPKLCLVQAATDRTCVLIDVLALDDIGPLLEFLSDGSRTKVLHAARQDLEVLLLGHSVPVHTVPAPIFDTQLAAGLLGYPSQIGYGDLVSKRLGHTLAKGHARTDWTRRPLSEEQLAYAADDVRYLVPLYRDLKAALEAEERLPWMAAECQMLENPLLYRTEPANAWQRLRGLDQLTPPQRSTAKALAAWREARAMKHDKPRGWILPDDALRSLSERLPQTVGDLAAVRGLTPAVIRKRGEELLDIVAQASAASADEAPASRPQRPDPRQMALVSKVMNFVRAEGERLRISPELLATRRDVEQLVYSGNAGGLASGWRNEVIGARLTQMVAAE